MRNYFETGSAGNAAPAPKWDVVEFFDEHVNLTLNGYRVTEHLSERARDQFIEEFRAWRGS